MAYRVAGMLVGFGVSHNVGLNVSAARLKTFPHLIELRPQCKLSGHFRAHRGPKLGYMLSGSVKLTVDGTVHTASTGDSAYLIRETPQ